MKRLKENMKIIFSERDLKYEILKIQVDRCLADIGNYLFKVLYVFKTNSFFIKILYACINMVLKHDLNRLKYALNDIFLAFKQCISL